MINFVRYVSVAGAVMYRCVSFVKMLFVAVNLINVVMADSVSHVMKIH